MQHPPPGPGPLLSRLNERQRSFVEAYWKDGHATRAAAMAGYAWPDKQGSRCLTYPAVRAALNALMELHRWEHDQKQQARWREELGRLFGSAGQNGRSRRRRKLKT